MNIFEFKRTSDSNFKDSLDIKSNIKSLLLAVLVYGLGISISLGLYLTLAFFFLFYSQVPNLP